MDSFCPLKTIEKYYDQTAWIYDLRLFITEKLILKKLRKKLLAKVTGKTLEIATGTGVNFQYYPQDLDLTAIDMSTNMIKVAYEKSKKLHLKVDIQKMDAENLNFPDDTFDTVVSTLALCSFPNPLQALQEIKRVCKPNGKMLFLEHGLSNKSWVRAIQKLRAKKHFEKYQCHTTREYLKLFDEAEFLSADFERRFLGIIYIIKTTKNPT